ncbi:hypothetical protein ACHAQJ_000172 [Trichoderma viride]
MFASHPPHLFNPNPSPLPTCGVYIIDSGIPKFLPLVSLDAHTVIVSSTSRTVLTQNFANSESSLLKNVRYVFPLYDGVSVVGFTCTVGSRVIKGVVKERQEAKRDFKNAVAQGKTAGLLEQSLEASDVFTTSLGNIPGGENVKVEITYLGELKHDAQVDGLRFTIPTSLAHRYGEHSLAGADNLQGGKYINITIDADVSSGSAIQSIQSPSHPISVNIGTLSTAKSAPPSLQRAHATLSQGSAELDKDFIIQIVATGLGDPMAVLETHPTIPNQRALMTTLVPRFNLPLEMSEVVFMCDRSGSMGEGPKIPNIINALKIFLKSLPVGVKFNICSFGSQHSFLWKKSKTYDQESLDEAIDHVSTFAANYGGTEMYTPMDEIFKRRYKDMNLELFLLTDGEIWGQERLFQLVNTNVSQSKGSIRVFTLGVGRNASHALIEGVARAGNGFAQAVGDDEKMDKMLVRMLKGALTPAITDYTLEIKYDGDEVAAEEEDTDDFEIIEKVMDAMTLEFPGPESTLGNEVEQTRATMSLFDQSIQDKDLEMSNADHSLKVNLPPVAVPRYLQAPFQIPPLFPFSRTTVYVLLSDSTPHRQPKSVILKGTSKHGPLSLEIPVAALTERGTTIHQLAARKATRELEDGRGWIFHVKNQRGKLLQQQFEGQFSDMVKREAVRLGTQYQVSGKWCSFIAIHQGDENADRQEDEIINGNEEGDKRASEFDGLDRRQRNTAASSLHARSRLAMLKRAKMQVAMPAGGPPAPMLNGCSSGPAMAGCARVPMAKQASSEPLPEYIQAALSKNSSAQQQAMQKQMQHPALPATMGNWPVQPQGVGSNHALQDYQSTPLMLMQRPMRLASNPPTTQGMSMSNMMGTTPPGWEAKRPSFPESAAMTTQGQPFRPPPQGQTFSQMLQFQAQAMNQKFQGQLMGQMSQGQATRRDRDMVFAAGAMKREPEHSTGNDSQKRARIDITGSFGDDGNTDVLSSLLALQTFAGNWQWNPRLESILGIKMQDATEKIQLPGQNQYLDVLATVCAVVFLKMKLADEKDVWELIVQKAEDWLRGTGANAMELEKFVQDTLFTN